MRALWVVLFTLAIFGPPVLLTRGFKALLGEELLGLSGVISVAWGVLCARIFTAAIERRAAKVGIALARERAWRRGKADNS